MFVAFFESVKYVGHLFPVAFLRVYLGYFYLSEALVKFQGDFLWQPKLADFVKNGLPLARVPAWYREFLELVVVPYWKIFAYIAATAQFAVGLAFLLGYLVRPATLVGVLISLNLLAFAEPGQTLVHKTFIAIHITLAWLGAGRCLGFDYFFYKRKRGIWW